MSDFSSTEDHRIRRRGEIQPDDIGRFRLEVRIVAREIALQRLEPRPLPDALHRHVTDAHQRGHPARGPLRER